MKSLCILLYKFLEDIDFYIANGFRRSWCFYRSHLLKNIENVSVVNCSTYLSIYYRYSAFCSGSLPVLRVSILAARQYSTRYNFRKCTFKCRSQFRLTVQLAVVNWFRHHSLYSVITRLCPNRLVQKWNKHHWLSGPNGPILSRSNQRTSRLTTWSRPLLEDPVVSQTVKQISRMLWNLKFQRRVHKRLTPFPVLAVLPSNLFKIRFNIILSSGGLFEVPQP